MSEVIKKEYSNIISGLDVGTTKVSYFIGSVDDSQKVEVLGVGSVGSEGIRAGAIVNLEAVFEAVQKARNEAEAISGVKTSSVWLSCGGPHIESFDSSGMIALYNKEINEDHTQRVIEMAKAVWIPTDRKILHVLPRDYTVDRQRGISDPKGMSGVRLEASVHIITASIQALRSYVKCVERAGLEMKGIVLRQYASALASLEEDEKNMGVSLVDIGGEFCDVITFVGGCVVHTAALPTGGDYFTQDIMTALRIPRPYSDELKKQYACALSDMVSEDEVMKLDGLPHGSNGRRKKTMPRKSLCQVIEPRVQDMFRLIQKELEDSGHLKSLGSGLVVTGGGSQMKGLVEAGTFYCHVPVRKAYPKLNEFQFLEESELGEKVLEEDLSSEEGSRKVSKTLDPSFTTGVGLLLYGAQREFRLSFSSSERRLSNKGQYKWNQFLKNVWEKAFPQITTGGSKHV